MLAGLSHPHVVEYYGLHFSKRRSEYNLIVEYVGGGNLADRIKLHPTGMPKVCSMSAVICIIVVSIVVVVVIAVVVVVVVAVAVQHDIIRLTRQLLDGVEYLHSKRIIHRDIKPGNLLLTLDGQLKIADFDTATHVVALSLDERSCVGTPWYTAPEIIMVEAYSVAVDVWSVGCCVLEMLTGQRPFHSANAVQALFKMVEEPHPPLPPPDSPTAVDVLARDFLMQCWRRPHDVRPSASVLLAHPWLSTVV
jgi:serine/threonine protein kinase